MSNRIRQASIGLSIGIASLGVAQAATDDFGVAVGLKVWSNRWTTNVPTSLPGLNGLVNLQFSTGQELVAIPSLSLRYRDWFLSGSVFPSKGYDVSGFGLDRKESDLNLGYRVVPGVILSLGYKQLSFRSGATVSLGGDLGLANYKATGPYIGTSLGAALGGGISVVGSFGVGDLKTKYEGSGRFSSQYVLGELGLAYGLPVSFAGLQGLSVGVGYRHQTLTVKNSAFAFGQRYRDVTQGVTMSVTGAF